MALLLQRYCFKWFSSGSASKLKGLDLSHHGCSYTELCFGEDMGTKENTLLSSRLGERFRGQPDQARLFSIKH